MNKDRLFWGTCFLLVAVLLITNQIFGPFDVGIITIVATMICMAIIIKSIPSINFSGILLPLAMLCTLYYDRIFVNVELKVWTIWVSAILASIGLEIIFKDLKKKYNSKHQMKRSFVNIPKNGIKGEKISVKNAFGEATKYISSDNFVTGVFENSFGSMSVYMDRTTVAAEGAVIRVDNAFGEMNLYIPAGWNVKTDIASTLGSINVQDRKCAPQTELVTIVGKNAFGEVTVSYT